MDAAQGRRRLALVMALVAIVIGVVSTGVLLTRSHWPESCSGQTDIGRSDLRPTSGAVGTEIRIQGPSVGTNKGGETVGDTRIEMWWNTEDWIEAGMGRQPHATRPGPVLLLGSQDLTRRCSYDLTVHVPDVPPGDHAITFVKFGGGGYGGYRAGTYHVTSRA